MNEVNSTASHQPKYWIWCPMKTEAKAARRGATRSKVTCTGIGWKKAEEFVAHLAEGKIGEVIGKAQTTSPSKLRFENLADAGVDDAKIVIVGFCGGLQEDAEPGQVIVATELRSEGETIHLELADKYAEHLNSNGVAATAAPIHCAKNFVFGKERKELGRTGAEVVEMESWWLATPPASSTTNSFTPDAEQPATQRHSFTPDAVIRIVVDSHSVIGGLLKLKMASRVITKVVHALEQPWQ